MNYQWQTTLCNKEKVNKLQEVLKIHPVVCQLLVQRGIETFEQAKAFFRMDLGQLHNPFLMKDMDKAVERIQLAIQQNENILIYGDYDVDGTTSIAVVYAFFNQFYDNIVFYVPDRHSEGYGVSYKGIDFAADNNFSLVIALDCGTSAVDKIEYANSKKIDFIICDHHTVGDKIPEAVALLNPKRKDCIYPYKELSGCGIGFKLCQAYTAKNNVNEDYLFQYLDFVAISIGCDIVPITGENRILAYFGLEKLNRDPSLGIKNLIELLDLNKDFTIGDVVFKIGPRINAAGRIGHASDAVSVLLGDAPVDVLQEKNTERQGLDKEITKEALEILKNEPSDKVTSVVYKKDWHKGVVGIVASRLIENYYKPTVVLCESNGLLTGSARSVSGFNVYEPLAACKHLFENFGGHNYAAGLSVKEENLEAFKLLFEEEVNKRILPEQLIPKLKIDAEIGLKDITKPFMELLKQMAPFGPGNMRPVFCVKGVKDSGYSKVVGENHLQLRLKDEFGNKIKGIAFQMAEKLEIVKNNTVNVVFTITENTWKGVTTLEMMVKDIEVSD